MKVLQSIRNRPLAKPKAIEKHEKKIAEVLMKRYGLSEGQALLKIRSGLLHITAEEGLRIYSVSPSEVAEVLMKGHTGLTPIEAGFRDTVVGILTSKYKIPGRKARKLADATGVAVEAPTGLAAKVAENVAKILNEKYQRGKFSYRLKALVKGKK
jgi:hypothetical protein